MILSIIIPVYNEAETIRTVVDKVRQVDLGDIQKEIIISDDGSSDQTGVIIEQITSQDPSIKLYSSPTNLGKGAAVRLGMALSTGEIIVIQDADLELDPNDLIHLLQPILQSQADVVYGSRFKDRNVDLPRRAFLANRLLTSLTNLLFGGKLTDMETAYKMFRRQAIQGIRLRSVRFDFEPEITAHFLKKGEKIIEVPIRYNPRSKSQGKKISWIDGFDAVYTLFRCKFIK